MTFAKASVASTMFGCPCSCSAGVGVVVAIAQPSGIRTTRARRSPASARSWIAAVSQAQLAGVDQDISERELLTGCDLRHRPANPATLSGLRASRIVSGRPSGFVSERCREW